MKSDKNPVFRIVNKINSILIFVFLLLLSVVIDGTIIYGISGSSLVTNERGLNNLQKEYGSYIHIAYSLDGQSEASILSFINPINEYNGYRNKEFGRNISHVSNQEFTVNYAEASFTCDYIVYEDYYSPYYTMNRFLLSAGSYEKLNQDNSVYVSSAFLSQIPLEGGEDPIGKTIKLSLDNDKDFVISGIINESSVADSGFHFNQLFDSSYILLNKQAIYQYGFTGLLFASSDDYFVIDSLDFIKAYNKSYLKYDDAWMRVSSYKEEQFVISDPFTVKYMLKDSQGSGFYSFISIFVLVISLLAFLTLILFYDFSKVKWYIKVPGGLILIAYLFLSTFYLTSKLKAALFMPRLATGLYMAFMIISLVAYIYAFSFFNYEAKKKEEVSNG